ncbi:MAG: hypothetical protein RJA20_1293 [Bacteroidota bacterium]
MRFSIVCATLVATSVFFAPLSLNAQCSTTQCSLPMPSVDPMEACILPGPYSLDCYYGETTSESPVSFPPWCTSIQNNQFFAFTADATTATFDISVYGCGTGSALQAAVLSTADCINFSWVSPCLGNIPSNSTASLTASGLVPGEVYYLCIDGSSGSQCEYSINASNPTVNGPATGICVPSSPIGTYTTQVPSTWQINPPSAGNFIGPSSGTPTVTVQWVEAGAAEICATSDICPNAPEFCLPVTVGEDLEMTEDVDLCQGYTVECAGQTFSQAGTFLVNLPSYLNCDSIIRCQVHLIPTVRVTETVYMCQGGSATCAGEEFFAPGSYPVNFTNYQGCDSIVTCKVNLIPTYYGPIQFINLCGPAQFQVCDNFFTNSGIYSEICTSHLGCDSIVNIDLAILEPDAVIAPPDTLDCGANVTITLDGTGSSTNSANGGVTLYQWSGPGIVGFNNKPTVVVNQPGEYCLVLKHSRGGLACFDTACVNVAAISAVPQLPQISGNILPCGDSTVIYTATANGLPSPTSFNWTVPGGVNFTPVTLGSVRITWDTVVSGQICVTANNSCGASQPACIPIAVQPPIQPPSMAGPLSVCANGGNYSFTLNIEQTGVNYNWTVPGGATFTGSGDTISVNFQNAVSGKVCVVPQNICGAIQPVCLDVTVRPTPLADLSQSNQICQGESSSLTFSLSGNGPFDVTWTNGSQTTTLNDIANNHSVTVNPAQTTTYKLLSIADNSAPVCSAQLLDSVTVTVRPNFSFSRTAQICEGESLLAGGGQQTVSGIYTDSLQTVYGCDSVIITQLTVYDIDTTNLNTYTCDPAQAGSTVQHFLQTNGCDSVVIRAVVLNPSNTIQLFDKSCNPNNVGVFTQNLTNQYGCDSTVITTITFSLSDTTYINRKSCDPSAVGIFYNPLTTADGCDSLIITTVTLSPSSATALSGSSCNPAEVGVFTKVLSNQYGCDSTVTTTILFNPLPVKYLTGSSCNTSQVGVFTKVYTTAGGCDSTVVTTITFDPLDKTYLTAATCDPAQVGVFTNTLTTSGGCDSTIITTVTLLPSNTTNLSSTTCNPAQAGVFTQVLTNRFGCDSTVITTISLLPTSQKSIQTYTCDPSQAGVFTYQLVNQFGCDSIVTETRTLLPSSATTVNLTSCNPAQVGMTTQVVPNQFGCDSTITTITTLRPPDACSVSATLLGSTIPCGQSTGTLTLTPTVGTAPFSYTVIKNGSPVNTGSVQALYTPAVINGLSPGSYTVNITSPNGFNFSVQAVINQLLPPDAGATVNSSYSGFSVSCDGASDGVALGSASGGQAPYQYVWSSGATTQQAAGLSSGTYTVTVTGSNGCTDTSTVTLSSATPMSISFVVNNLNCFGQNSGAVKVNVTGGAPPYTYRLNDGPEQTTNLFSNLMAGTFIATVYDANRCEKTEVIVVNAAIQVDVNLGDDLTISQGDEASLRAILNLPIDSIEKITWTPPFDSSDCPQCPDQVVRPFISTVYSIEVQALNGCKDRDDIAVRVDRRRQIYVANVFSPNEDGANDILSVFAKPGSVTNILYFRIYDRWGNEVYELQNFLPNNPTQGWDGTFNGEPMDPGVFVWAAEIEFIDGERIVYKGDVTIVR